MNAHSPENWHGLAGPPKSGEDIGHDWWYVWSTGGSWTDPKRVILDKLRSQDVNEDYIAELGTLAANDPLTGPSYTRSWILFNEPDNGNESNWALNPWGAAEWYRKAFVAIRDANAYTVIGAPSLITVQEDGTTILVWDPESETNRSWLDLFLEALDTENENKPEGDPDAQIEIYAVHAYDNYVSYHFSRMENHITWLREVLAMAYDCINEEIDIWITECSALTGSAVININWMNNLITWLWEEGFDAYGVKRVAWFVTFDSWWWSYYPGCSLWQPDNGSYKLTNLGNLWKGSNNIPIYDTAHDDTYKGFNSQVYVAHTGSVMEITPTVPSLVQIRYHYSYCNYQIRDDAARVYIFIDGVRVGSWSRLGSSNQNCMIPTSIGWMGVLSAEEHTIDLRVYVNSSGDSFQIWRLWGDCVVLDAS